MANLTEVNLKTNKANIGDYKKITPAIVGHLMAESKKMSGYPILYVNATQVGGGVAEMLMSQIPLERAPDKMASVCPI